MNEKLCSYCSKILRGRTDKKFCNDQCRNTFNNQRNASWNNIMRNINYILSKNRRILHSLFLLNEDEPSVYTLNQLLLMGFQKEYFTHEVVIKGKLCKAVYDYTIIEKKEKMFTIIKTPSYLWPNKELLPAKFVLNDS